MCGKQRLHRRESQRQQQQLLSRGKEKREMRSWEVGAVNNGRASIRYKFNYRSIRMHALLYTLFSKDPNNHFTWKYVRKYTRAIFFNFDSIHPKLIYISTEFSLCAAYIAVQYIHIRRAPATAFVRRELENVIIRHNYRRNLYGRESRVASQSVHLA